MAQKRLAQEGRIGPEAQRKIREEHDYIFHDDERYQRAAREAEAVPQGGGQGDKT